LVRAYIGNERLDTKGECEWLNAIYDQMWVYYNLFQPVMHMVGKQAVGGKVKRKWDEARSPYQRLVEMDEVAKEGPEGSGEVLRKGQAGKLKQVHMETNPRQLRREIEQMRDRLWDKPQEEAGEALTEAQQVVKVSSRARGGELAH
jgi:hypothetical protein